MFERDINGRAARIELDIFDAQMDELFSDKIHRLKKFEQTHGLKTVNGKQVPCKKDKTPKDRKDDRVQRMKRVYSLTAYTDNGRTIFYWEKKSGPKKWPEYHADILRNMKAMGMYKILCEDWELE